MNPTKTTPKDFFLHLAATIVLYTAAIALVNLVFAVINYQFPDALASYFYAGSIAWPISVLVVLVPVLYVLEWLIAKDIRIMPEKDTLWIRRWRIYLTLFLAGATIIGDLIVLINIYLSGEITERFIYKFLAILIIFGVIFAYYILEKITTRRKTQKVLAWVGIAIVLAAIIGGFIINGSPFKQRGLRFDNQRVSDLQNLQWQVVNHWQQKGTLPASLDVLKDSIRGNIVPTDPETKKPYEYAVKSDKSFELCANFALKVEDNEGRGANYGGGYYGRTSMMYPDYGGMMPDENWKHDAGRTCFTRTIDPELYPPYPKPTVRPL